MQHLDGVPSDSFDMAVSYITLVDVPDAHCVLTTDCNGLDGLDLVVEGDAVTVSDPSERARVADTYESKYGTQFTAPEGTWFGLGDAIRRGEVLLYGVAPSTAFGFGKGTPFSQTRWSFS